MSLNNTSVRLIEADGSMGEPHYFFSISEKALVASPWRRGTIYFLPRNSFEQQAPSTFQGQPILIPQWAGAEPVVPLARIEAGPEDFPLLGQIRGHDDEIMFARARKNPDGFPWID